MNSAIYTPYSIKGQTVLITGASSGIGEACAWRFAEAGCRLVLLARRAERLADIQQQLQAAYGDIEVHTVVLDVRDTDAVTALPYSLPGDFREVDILLNNAGERQRAHKEQQQAMAESIPLPAQPTYVALISLRVCWLLHATLQAVIG